MVSLQCNLMDSDGIYCHWNISLIQLHRGDSMTSEPLGTDTLPLMSQVDATQKRWEYMLCILGCNWYVSENLPWPSSLCKDVQSVHIKLTPYTSVVQSIAKRNAALILNWTYCTKSYPGRQSHDDRLWTIRDGQIVSKYTNKFNHVPVKTSNAKVVNWVLGRSLHFPSEFWNPQ